MTASGERAALDELGAEIRAAAWELACETVDEGLRDDTVPSLARVGELGRLGAMPAFIAELGRGLSDPDPGHLRPGSPLAALVRDHARERESLGFEPREIVTEFLLLRRVLWRFVTSSGTLRGAGEFPVAERRLNDTIDRLVIECVVAYFDRATTELAEQARRDPLTGLLNHQAFTTAVEREVERARRYAHGVSLLFLDVDSFKRVNDTLGHPAGDAALRCLATVLRESLRASDLAGRMGGDEFAACLVESEAEAAGTFAARVSDRIDELVAAGELPGSFAVSIGVGHFPSDTPDAVGLFRIADERLYGVKREKA